MALGRSAFWDLPSAKLRARKSASRNEKPVFQRPQASLSGIQLPVPWLERAYSDVSLDSF